MNGGTLGIRDEQHVVTALRRHDQVVEVDALPDLIRRLVVRDPARDVVVFSRGRRKLVEADNGETEYDEVSPYTRRKVCIHTRTQHEQSKACKNTMQKTDYVPSLGYTVRSS